jgi:hypothetical protein
MLHYIKRTKCLKKLCDHCVKLVTFCVVKKKTNRKGNAKKAQSTQRVLATIAKT